MSKQLYERACCVSMPSREYGWAHGSSSFSLLFPGNIVSYEAAPANILTSNSGRWSKETVERARLGGMDRRARDAPIIAITQTQKAQLRF